MMDRLSDHISETSHKDVLIEDQLKELRGGVDCQLSYSEEEAMRRLLRGF